MLKNFEDRYYDFLRNKLGVEKHLSIRKLNLFQPWYSIFWSWKLSILVTYFFWFLALAYDALIPVMAGFALQNLSLSWLVWILIGYGIRFTVSYFSLYNIVTINESIYFSLQYEATRFFLTTDPLNQALKSSGQIISKINRSTQSLNSLFTIFTFSICPAIIFTIVSFGIFFNVNKLLGITVLFLNILQVAVMTFIMYKGNKLIVPKIIKIEDKQKSLQVETLQQALFIRSAFATNEQDKVLKSASLKHAVVQATKTVSIIFLLTLSRYFLLICLSIVSIWLFFLLKTESASLIIATTIFLSYNDSLSKIVDLGNVLEQAGNHVLNLEDLFSFIKNFGKQTFPVLEDD